MAEKQEEQLYKVVWTDVPQGKDHEGQPVSKNVADAAVEAMNRKYPELKHRAVPVAQPKNPPTADASS